MAAKTGNSYIRLNMKDRIEIQTADLELLTTVSSKKLIAGD